MKTPEYFNKRLKNVFNEPDKSYFIDKGYNEALEKTNAKELYEALLFAKSHIEKCCVMTDGNIVINRINQTIEKANKL